MVSTSMLRYLLGDDESLDQYFCGNVVTAEQVSMRTFLKERIQNRKLPDHHYRLQREKDFGTLKTLAEILRSGLYQQADEHLEMRGNRIHVRQNKQNLWQELITFIPPLVLQCAYLHFKRPLSDMSRSSLLLYKQDILLPNFKYTALPYPYIPQLEDYLTASGGLHDLHMHLNGTTETDVAWQDHLFTPKKIHDEIQMGFQNPKVREQFAQESHLLTPKKYYELLLIARKIRGLLFDFTIARTTNLPENVSIENLFSFLVNAGDDKVTESYQHPFADLTLEYAPDGKLLIPEALMYCVVFRYLVDEPRDSIAGMFHFYLLILGLCNRLLVQQVHQYGFEQFQKHTLNGLRETSEKQFRSRFFQLHGNELRNLSFLEGRFSPKESEADNLALLTDIERGWSKLKEGIIDFDPLAVLPELRLTAHFIKKEGKKVDEFVRFRDLRVNTWIRARVLAFLHNNKATVPSNIVGIDAAASEFDTPPEVFAPSFRMLRRKGFSHFTYHAGEDFFHLISGMRAIYEAVEFNELQASDRIGHGTAVGLSTNQWCAAVGSSILIREGEWLDSLVFAYHICNRSTDLRLKKRITDLLHAIQQLSWNVYGVYYSAATLESAWLMRKYCPIHLLKDSMDDVRLTPVFDQEEWDQIFALKLDRQLPPFTIFAQYHSKQTRKKYDRIVSVETEEIFCSDELELLQKEVLKYLHLKEIVIETLPTSNVRIGYHADYSTYHLWNWIRWAKDGLPVPPIVVGTDDTGIFATNIINELANIYCHLTTSGKMSHNQAMDVVKELNEKSRIYRFI